MLYFEYEDHTFGFGTTHLKVTHSEPRVIVQVHVLYFIFKIVAV